MKCRNTRYDHECHPIYAAKYDGYCLNCANAGVPDLDWQIADLRAQVFGHCGTAVSDVRHNTPEALEESARKLRTRHPEMNLTERERVLLDRQLRLGAKAMRDLAELRKATKRGEQP